MVERITPEKINKLENGQVFVFGSNLAGRHGAGAAYIALTKFGARMGKGSGLFGKSYGIPTKDRNIRTLTTSKITPHINRFITFASKHPNLIFLVTEIGCGLAGYKPKDIAPLFEQAKALENVHLPERFWQILNQTKV